MAFLLAFLLLPAVHASLTTKFDEPFKDTCLNNKILKHLVSTHDDYYEDRQWTIDCGDNPVHANLQNCEWTDYVDNWDGSMGFVCSNNRIISGIQSIHDNYYEDRRYKFLCCEAVGYLPTSCSVTDYVNNFDESLDFTVPDGKAIIGVNSEHSNYYEDRRFKFNVCSLTAKGDS